MDEEKKSEASREEPERLGPYLLQEQVQQSHDSQEELYLATHETSGATALVRKHAAEESGASPHAASKRSRSNGRECRHPIRPEESMTCPMGFQHQTSPDSLTLLSTTLCNLRVWVANA
jgi:hypothetical protein